MKKVIILQSLILFTAMVVLPQPEFVGDPTVSGNTSSSNPQHYFLLNDELYFFTSNDLWTTDGTEEGTRLVYKEIHGTIEHITNSSQCFFISLYRELWKTDGSAEGTVNISLNNDYGYLGDCQELFANETDLYFIGHIDDNLTFLNYDIESGTISEVKAPSGSTFLDFYWPPFETVIQNEHIYLYSYNSYLLKLTDNRCEEILDESGQSIVSFTRMKLIDLNDTIYFIKYDIDSIDIYYINPDSPVAGLVTGKEWSSQTPYNNPTILFGKENKLFLFDVFKENEIYKSGIWKVNKEPGTIDKILEFNFGSSRTGYYDETIKGFFCYSNKVYLILNNFLNSVDKKFLIYQFDPGTYDTSLVESYPISNSFFYDRIQLEDSLLISSNGSILNLNSIVSTSTDLPFDDFYARGRSVFYSDYQEKCGYELFRYDINSDNSILVKDLNEVPVSSLTGMTKVNDKIVFAAYDTSNGNELWGLQGIETFLLKDLFTGKNEFNKPNSSMPESFVKTDNTVLFTYTDTSTTTGNFYKIGITDGTSENTKTATSRCIGSIPFYIYSHKGMEKTNIIRLKNRIYFMGKNYFLYYKHDSDAKENIYPIYKGFEEIDSIIPYQMAYSATSLFVFGNVYSQQGNSFQLGRIDQVGDYHFIRNYSSSGAVRLMFPLNETILISETVDYLPYLVAYTDGESLQLGNFDYISTCYGSADNLAFFASNGLWRTDGTVAGTFKLIDLYQTIIGLNVSVTTEGKVYFMGIHDSGTGLELLESDGSVEGTKVIDVAPGPISSFPSGFKTINNLLFFTARDENDLRAIYCYPVKDSIIKVKTGDLKVGSQYEELDGYLYFSAEDSEHGGCIYRIPFNMALSNKPLKENLELSQLISPNPVTDYINIEDYYNAYRIYNLQGILINEGNIFSEKSINVSKLKSGIYIIQLSGSKYYEGKFVKF